MRSVVIAASACLALTMSTNAYADDVNRTGQPQKDESNKSNKSGAASQGGDANTMGGATTEKTEPAQMPEQAPPYGTQPETKPKPNAKPDAPDSGNR